MKENLAEAINRQIVAEFYSGYLYLQMAAWFERNNMKGFASWMRVQAQEEASHAMIMFNHMADRGIPVVLGAIEAPGAEYASAVDVFAKTYRHEQAVTASIHNLVRLAEAEKDGAAQTMLDWFVEEQVEEEESALAILNRLEAAGNPRSIGFALVESDLAARTFSVPSPLRKK